MSVWRRSGQKDWDLNGEGDGDGRRRRGRGMPMQGKLLGEDVSEGTSVPGLQAETRSAMP